MGYRIKTVSTLTGVPRNTLLAWERRYGIVQPSRQDNGYREYSDSDIACLQSVKRLLDQGYKVSEAINLIDSAREQGATTQSMPGQLSIGVIHQTLPEQLADSTLLVVRSAATLEAFLEEPADTQAELLLTSLGVLGDDPLGALQLAMNQIGATQAVVIYQFATHAVLQRLVGASVRLIHGSPRVSVIQQAIKEQAALHQLLAPERTPLSLPVLPAVSEEEVPRRFTDEQLARLREIRSSVDCECPNHIAALVTSLLAFETYSRDCERRSPQDTSLHGYLTQTTGAARQLLEGMLEAVIIEDQLEL
ncbi:MAG: DNA-binding transcriptional MerR regulator [Myxococcota bacterium]|jgi:DNA-binding transcriptional MerR regulator